MGSVNSNMGEHWITVTASSGMFSDEFAVSIKLFDGRSVSLFANKRLVKETDKGAAFLKVMLVNSDPTQKKELVLLPTETFETASRWVEVPA